MILFKEIHHSFLYPDHSDASGIPAPRAKLTIVGFSNIRCVKPKTKPRLYFRTEIHRMMRAMHKARANPAINPFPKMIIHLILSRYIINYIATG